jgi:outer membrane protein assembly factor BamB
MWRGPAGTGVASQGDPPVTWSETRNVKWKVAFPGEGSSSPIVWADKIFFLTAIKTDKVGPAAKDDGEVPFHGGRRPKNVYQFDLVCLDHRTGQVLWQRTAHEAVPHEGHHPDHGFASYSPVTDGKLVWAGMGSRGVHCYDLAGNHKWSRDLGTMKTRAMFGEGSSPGLAGNALIVVMDQEEDSFVYALDKNTGRTLWKRPRDERTSWSTPVATQVDDRMQVIISATNFVRAYDLQTGDVIWKCAGQTGNVIPTPIIAFGLVFCTSGFRGNALQAIELGHTGDLTGTDAIRWQVDDATPYVPSPILYGDRLYVCSGNRPIVSCYDARTGKAHFSEQRLDAIKGIYASPVGAAGRIYFVGRRGNAQVIRDADQLEVLVTNVLDDEFDASPAIVGDEIYLKGKRHLYCIAKQ